MQKEVKRKLEEYLHIKKREGSSKTLEKLLGEAMKEKLYKVRREYELTEK